jgi:hypothetical protein
VQRGDLDARRLRAFDVREQPQLGVVRVVRQLAERLALARLQRRLGMRREQAVAGGAPERPALRRRQRPDLRVQLEDGALPVEEVEGAVDVDVSFP